MQTRFGGRAWTTRHPRKNSSSHRALETFDVEAHNAMAVAASPSRSTARCTHAHEDPRRMDSCIPVVGVCRITRQPGVPAFGARLPVWSADSVHRSSLDCDGRARGGPPTGPNRTDRGVIHRSERLGQRIEIVALTEHSPPP